MKTVLIALVVAGVLTLAGLGRPSGPAGAAHARPGGSGGASSSVVSLRGAHLLPEITPRPAHGPPDPGDTLGGDPPAAPLPPPPIP